MEKRLEDEIDEIIEKEIQNVRKNAQNFNNFVIFILTNLAMSTWKHLISCLFPSWIFWNILNISMNISIEKSLTATVYFEH